MTVIELEMVPDSIQVSERSRRVTFAGQLGTLGNKQRNIFLGLSYEVIYFSMQVVRWVFSQE